MATSDISSIFDEQDYAYKWDGILAPSARDPRRYVCSPAIQLGYLEHSLDVAMYIATYDPIYSVIEVLLCIQRLTPFLYLRHSAHHSSRCSPPFPTLI